MRAELVVRFVHALSHLIASIVLVSMILSSFLPSLSSSRIDVGAQQPHHHSRSNAIRAPAPLHVSSHIIVYHCISSTPSLLRCCHRYPTFRRFETQRDTWYS